MDLATAQTELRDRGFDYLSDGRLTVILNSAKNALEDEYPWPWLETTTTGTAPLTISDLKQVLYVVDTTNSAELAGTEARSIIAQRDATISTAGTPDSWWLDGTTTLKVYPTSTTVSLSVRYIKASPELSATTDTPLIPTRYHPVWLDYATIEAYRDAANEQQAAQLLNDVRGRKLPEMIAQYALRNLNGPTFTQSTWHSVDW
jgi:hypothetical protein